MALVFVPDIAVHLHLKIKAFREVYPVNSFAPRRTITLLLKQLIELLFGPFNVLLRGVDYKVIILGEDGDKCCFLKFAGPGELVYKMEQFGLVDSIPLGETGYINNAMQDNVEPT